MELIGNLIRLRYKLLWAKTRTRNGKIAVFMVGYLLLALLLVFLTMGGLGAGMLAVRSGKAEMLTRGVLSGLFVNALMASVILGFGVNALFAETELRRYPLSVWERRVARHLIGILDPFWFLSLALELGLAVGLYVLGAAALLPALVAVLFLMLCNYLAARVLALLIERIMARKNGSAVLLAAVLVLSIGPSLAMPMVRKNPAMLAPVLGVLHFSPPFAAAAVITRTDLAALGGMGLLILWIVGLLAALASLDRGPARVRVVRKTAISWDSPWERLGAFFGPRYGPLMAHWLRFYARNSRFRTIYTLALPLSAVLLVAWGRQKSSLSGPFAAALSAFSILGCMGTAQLAVNQFGYTGGGFRRFLLIPEEPSVVLRAGSYTFVLLSLLLIALGALLFTAFAPFAWDARMLAMLIGVAVTGLFVMHGLGLWATLYGPRSADYYSSFGNDLSTLGNVVVIGGMMPMIFAPQILSRVYPAAMAPERWWLALPVAGLAAAFYFASLDRAGALLMKRRERLLAVVEGRS